MNDLKIEKVIIVTNSIGVEVFSEDGNSILFSSNRDVDGLSSDMESFKDDLILRLSKINLSHREIGDVLCISRQAVSKRYNRLVGSNLVKIKKGVKPVDSKLKRNSVSKRITNILKLNNISRKDFSFMTGINQSALSSIINEKYEMSLKIALKLQNAGFGDAKTWVKQTTEQ